MGAVVLLAPTAGALPTALNEDGLTGSLLGEVLRGSGAAALPLFWALAPVLEVAGLRRERVRPSPVGIEDMLSLCFSRMGNDNFLKGFFVVGERCC